MIPRKRDGSTAVGGGSKMTYRYYLQEATFATAMEVPAARTKEFAEALQAPVWDLYLGRKCCAPTDFVFRGNFDTETAAIEAAAAIAAENHSQNLSAFATTRPATSTREKAWY